MLDDVLLFFDDMPDDVSNGNHSTRLPQSNNGEVAEVLIHHHLHALIDTCIRGNRKRVTRHEFLDQRVFGGLPF